MPELVHNPYVGPRTFTPQEGDRFFGREREARDLLAVVISERLTLFYAKSGAGKSSLINTRLIPQLRAEQFVVLPVGRVSGELPAGVEQVDNIFIFNLLLSLDQSQGDPRRFAYLSLNEFATGLTTPDGEYFYYNGVEAKVEEDEGQTVPPHLLIIDQFEEIITTHPARWPEREDFFGQLAQLLANDPLLWIVLTLREDYVAALDPYAALLPGKLQNRFYMQRMEAPAALVAIKEPAILGGRPFAPGVAEMLVDNLRQIRVQGQPKPQPGQFVEPVNLQVVCYQLWENLKERPLGEITAQDLQELGNVDTALAEFYEQALRHTLQQTSVSEVALRHWFEQRLITEAGTRGTVYAGTTETAGLSNLAVKLLADQFLLRAEIRSGGTWYELVHDRFIEPILQANRAWREQRLRQSPLIQAAQSWADTGREPHKLYRDEQLQEAVAATDQANLDPLVAEFLAAGQEAQRQRELAEATHRTRRLQRFTLILSGVVLLAIIAAAYAVYQQNVSEMQAKALRSLQLAALSANELYQSNHEIALLLALEAGRISETGDASAAIDRALAPLGHVQLVLTGHTAGINQLSWNADGSRILSAGEDGTVRVWNVETGQELIQFTHTAKVNQASWNAGGSRILSASEDGTARVWDVETGEELIRLTGHTAGVNQASWNAGESQILTASADGTARVWDAETGEELIRLAGHTAGVNQASWNADESHIVTASADGTARVWNVQRREEVARLVHPAEVNQASWSPDRMHILTASADGLARVWNGQRREEVARLPHEAEVNQVSWSPDRVHILTVSADGLARVWNAQTSKELIRLASHTAAINQASWNAYGSRILTTSDDGAIQVWDAQQGAELIHLTQADRVNQASWNADESRIVTASADGTIQVWNLRMGAELVHLTHQDQVNQASWNMDESRILTASNDGTARVWDAQTGVERVRLSHTDQVNQASWNVDESRILTASADGTARVWDAETGEELLSLTGHSAGVNRARWNTDGSRILTASGDGTARVWDAETGEALLSLSGHTAGVNQASWNRDGSRILTAGEDGTVRVWDAQTGEELVRLTQTDQVNQASWSNDSRHILTASNDGTVRIWDAQKGGEVVLFTHPDKVNAATWDADGGLILTASADGIARVWEAQSGEEIISFVGHTAEVNGASWTANHNRILTAGADGTIRVWDMHSKEESLRFVGHIAGVNQASWNRDGSRILTAGEDGTVRVFYARLKDLLKAACQRAPRNMTRLEWERFIKTIAYRATCDNLPVENHTHQP